MKNIRQHLLKFSLILLIGGLSVACSDDDDGYMNPTSPDFTPDDVITQNFDNTHVYNIVIKLRELS